MDSSRNHFINFETVTERKRRKTGGFGTAERERLAGDSRHVRRDTRSARLGRLLVEPAWTSRIWMANGKRVYLLITQLPLERADRQWAGDRQNSR